MKNQRTPWFAAFLLLIFTVSLIPLNWLHDHHDQDNCRLTDHHHHAVMASCRIALEGNVHHMPIAKCMHKEHINEQPELCKLCKHEFSKEYQTLYTFIENYISEIDFIFRENSISVVIIGILSFGGRDPPVKL